MAFDRFQLPLKISERRTLLIVVDLTLVNLAIFFGLWIWSLRTIDPLPTRYLFSFPVLAIVWFVVAVLNDFYNAHISANIWRTIKALGKIHAMLLIPYLLVYFLSPPRSLPRFFVISQMS